jgi:alpha-methylacyl-CoA racemase
MFLVTGVLAGVLHARATGQGQVVDAAMTDGLAVLQALTLTMRAMGQWADQRQSNLLDGGAPRYDTYPCSDGRHVAIGALEPQFYARLLQGLGLADDARMQQPDNPAGWPAQREAIAAVLRTQPRDHWAHLFEGTDACLSPVLSLAEAPTHPHNAARGSFLQVGNLLQPGLAPRFSASAAAQPPALPPAQPDVAHSLNRWGWGQADIDALLASGQAR